MRILHSASETATVELDHDELRTLSNALNEVCHGPDAIEDWEFQTRMGVSRQKAKSLLAEFGQLLGD